MKSQIKKIVSIFACICLLLSAMVITASAATTEIVFNFGENVATTTHADGTTIDPSKSYTSGDYTLTLTDTVKCYDGANDATGVSALKMGTGSAVGSFTMTVPDDVTSVIFKVAKYKAKDTTVDINGAQHVINTSSNDGAYTAVTVDTTTTKAITFATVSGKTRCMIDSITYVIGDTTGGDDNTGDETPVEISEKTIAEVLAMEDGDTKFYITAEIVDTYRDTWATYGNFILKDDSTEDTIILYGLADENGNRYDAMETKPVVGDTVKVLANRSSYKGVGQLANAVLVELIPGETPETPENPETPEEPETPAATLEVVDTPVADTAYKFGMVQGNLENAVYYLAGGMDGYYMATTTDAEAAIDIYVEETTGGYYLYTMVDGAKTYINMVVSGTHVNGAYEAAASTVYTYDAEAKTMVATVNDELYWFATRNDNTYTTLGPAMVSYAGFYGQFYAEPVVDDGNDDSTNTGDDNTAGDTTTGGTTAGGSTTNNNANTNTNTDNSTKSPDTGDNMGAVAMVAIAAAAVLVASKKRA
ncbi:MAG: hypothetical protein IJY79_02610 [Clostridia bacterium]|nr:hypothetical protein [Clostridia bacterium]